MKDRDNVPPGGFSRRRFLQATAAAGVGLAAGRPFAAWGRDEMNLRPIPSTGERLPVIGLGTWQTFDFSPDSAEAEVRREVLQRFYETGGRAVDSSPMYGQAEALVGKLAQDLKLSDQLFLATKVWTRGRENGVDQMQQSARRLRRSVIDLMQVHNLVDVDTHLLTLRAMKSQGLIRYIGVTHYTEAAYDRIMALMRSRSQPLDFVQFNYNIAAREAEKRLLPLAADLGVATMINEPFEKGSLFHAVRGRKLPEWAKEFNCESWAQFFLKYIASHPAVTCAIPATGNPQHVVDNTRAGFGRLPSPAMRKRMASFFNSL